jgi:hypothetical protein
MILFVAFNSLEVFSKLKSFGANGKITKANLRANLIGNGARSGDWFLAPMMQPGGLLRAGATFFMSS